MIGVRLDRGVLWIRPYGERLDAAVAPSLRAAVADALSQRPRFTIINAESLNFVDSTGLGAIVSIMKQMDSQGALAIAGANTNLKRLLMMTGLDQVFRLYPDVTAAELDLLGNRG